MVVDNLAERLMQNLVTNAATSPQELLHRFMDIVQLRQDKVLESKLEAKSICIILEADGDSTHFINIENEDGKSISIGEKSVRGEHAEETVLRIYAADILEVESFSGNIRSSLQETTCTWAPIEELFEEKGTWFTGCGKSFNLSAPSPQASGIDYCPYCGGRIKRKNT